MRYRYGVSDNRRYAPRYKIVVNYPNNLKAMYCTQKTIVSEILCIYLFLNLKILHKKYLEGS